MKEFHTTREIVSRFSYISKHFYKSVIIITDIDIFPCIYYKLIAGFLAAPIAKSVITCYYISEKFNASARSFTEPTAAYRVFADIRNMQSFFRGVLLSGRRQLRRFTAADNLVRFRYNSMENMIYAENLRKEFKKIIKEPGLKGAIKALFKPEKQTVTAVDDISFSVPRGEILGFIGPNGAGKSTVIKMLTGILMPTSGMCRINGKIPQEDRKNYVREIGVVFGQRTQLWWDLALRETYAVLKEIYQVPDDQYKKRMAFLNEVLELDSFITSPVRTLSLGQRMRADIAASLLHSPKVLFLDEPTIGLDVVVKENIRNAIREINAEEGTTVILTTHDLSDIELLCERIVMIDKGKKVFDGALSELRHNFGDVRTLEFELVNAPDFKLLDYRRRFSLGDDHISAERDKSMVRVRFDTAEVSVEEVISYTLSTVHVKDLNIKDVEIEEIIKRLYRREVSL